MVHDTLASSVTNYFRLHFSSPYVGLKLLGWYLGAFFKLMNKVGSMS